MKKCDIKCRLTDLEMSPKKVLFLNQNICCGYSKELSQLDSSFEHPKHMLKLIAKKIIAFLRSTILLSC